MDVELKQELDEALKQAYKLGFLACLSFLRQVFAPSQFIHGDHEKVFREWIQPDEGN